MPPPLSEVHASLNHPIAVRSGRTTGPPPFAPVQPWRCNGLCVLMALARPARAQTSPDPAAIGWAGADILTGHLRCHRGPRRGSRGSQSGTDYRVRLPLAGFSAPPDAAVDAVARPVASGLLDIMSMTFPAARDVQTAPAGGCTSRISYSIGQQRITGKVDPTLAYQSSYAADFGTSGCIPTRANSTASRRSTFATDGTFSAGSDGRLTLASQGRGTGFHFIGHGPDGVRVGRHRPRGGRPFCGRGPRSRPGHPSAGGCGAGRAARGPAQRESTVERRTRRVADAATVPAVRMAAADGLLNRIEAEETLEDVRFAVGAPTGGTKARSAGCISMAGDALRATAEQPAGRSGRLDGSPCRRWRAGGSRIGPASRRPEGRAGRGPDRPG